MTVAGGAVITPRMLDVLSSGGVTNAQALAQGPYLKIRWAVGVSRGRWDRRRGVEEALWRRRWRCSARSAKFLRLGALWAKILV